MSERFFSLLNRTAVFVTGIIFLSLSAIWNGQPFFYPDTPTYVRGAEMGLTKALGTQRVKAWTAGGEPANALLETGGDSSTKPGNVVRQQKPLTSIDDKIVLAGRSVYYGLLLYLSYAAGGMWLTVLVQALVTVFILELILVRIWGFGGRTLLATLAVLSALTPLGIYTGFLMPDIFAPLVILCFAILVVYWPQLGRRDCWLVGLVLLFGLTAHASHVAIIALMLLVATTVRWFAAGWRQLSAMGLAVVFACVCGAVAAEWLFSKAVTVAIGAPPLRLPHPMGRLIDLGPGTDFLKKNCPQSGYAVCKFVQNYPTKWDDFLFSTDEDKGTFALADAALKRRISAEQLPFVLDVLRHDPGGVLLGVSADVIHQLFNFRVDLWSYGEKGVEKFYSGRVPDSIFTGLLQSRASKNSFLNTIQTATTYGLFAASIIFLCIFVLRKNSKNARVSAACIQALPFSNFCWVALSGVGLNAVICATLASSMDRFQARVVWLIPLIVWAMYKVNISDNKKQSFAGSNLTKTSAV
jgi:hypothetical protein